MARVKVVGCHIGLALLTPIAGGTRCDNKIKEAAPRFSVHKVAIPHPNLCSIVSVTEADTWVRVFFDIPSARVFDGWREVRALRQVSVHKKFGCERHTLQCESGAFSDYLRSPLSAATGNDTRPSLSSFSAIRVNPLGLRSGVSEANGNIEIAYEYIDVIYLLSLL